MTHKCYNCFEKNTITEQIEGNNYVFCFKCNPNKSTDREQKGYYGLCTKCNEMIDMLSEDCYCSKCNKMLCQICYDVRSTCGNCQEENSIKVIGQTEFRLIGNRYEIKSGGTIGNVPMEGSGDLMAAACLGDPNFDDMNALNGYLDE